MREFFRSRRFRVMLCIICVMLVLTVATGAMDGWTSPQSSVVGTVTTPVQSAGSTASGWLKNIFGVWAQNRTLQSENAQLRQQLQSATSQALNDQELQNENDFYKQFLDIKKANPDYVFQPATKVAVDANSKFYDFQIDKGAVDGIAARDPVITADGLVGYIRSVGPTYAVVTTILDPAMNVPAKDQRTRDAGITQGDITLAPQNLLSLTQLTQDATVSLGDYIVTSGGNGIFPDGLMIGTVKQILPKQNISLSAEISPAADIVGVRDVMVMTSFTGQGTTGAASASN